ncbi:MAG: hydroxymethylbilane synthase [Myxococcaceae bacterium]|nr:hydroxymethylbilane synthase [Myxococcaceae bacterium]MBH2006802.1 hydroxymethylbilane synthase [Myxococcaceae bacterium]
MGAVQEALEKAWPNRSFAIQTRETHGDRNAQAPLPEIGGQGLFTAELGLALSAGEIDLAVHSHKDLPIEQPRDLCLGAFLPRGPTDDVLVSQNGYTLETLPLHAVIGTSSARRQAQLLWTRPDLRIVNLRGNIGTRLEKSQTLDAIILAQAGLERLGLSDRISQILPKSIFLPAPAQGSIAVQCLDRLEYHDLLRPIHDTNTEHCTAAERAFLKGLGGGCSLPIAAYAEKINAQIHLRVQVLKPDGSARITQESVGDHPVTLGLELAKICIAEGAHEYLRK